MTIICENIPNYLIGIILNVQLLELIVKMVFINNTICNVNNYSNSMITNNNNITQYTNVMVVININNSYNRNFDTFTNSIISIIISIGV